jgi:hypothetical protein
MVESIILDVRAMEIGNLYLKALTADNVYIKAALEFAELEVHALVISNAWYGLLSFVNGCCLY